MILPVQLAQLFLPESASSVSGQVDMLYGVLVVISALLMGGLSLLVAVFLIRYRKNSRVSRRPDCFQSLTLEISWTIATLVVFLALGMWGALLYMRMARLPDEDSIQIYAVGRQWMWELIHPGGRREHNMLHVPVGQVVRITTISEDVIHSFFVPAFRVKHDVMPHRYTTLWFKATKPGIYDLYCTEFCGNGHSIMTGKVVVMSPEDYAEWTAQGDEQESLALLGKQLFTQYGCSGCHSSRSDIHAPALEGLFGSPVPLANGGMVIADEAYIHDSILLPNKHVAAGFEPVMPTFEGIMPPGDVFALVEYIKSLAYAKLPPGAAVEVHKAPGKGDR